MKGRSIVLKGPNLPMEIQEHEVPDPEPGAIILRMTMAGVCGSDLHRWRGDLAAGSWPAAGVPMGHEGTGIIHALGAGVASDSLGIPLREGDRVVFSGIVPCQRCRYCLNGDQNYCSSGKGIHLRAAPGQFPFFIGTFGDYIYLSPNQPVFKAPGELADEALTPANCAFGTVMQGLLNAGLTAGQSVVFQGVGGLGLAGTGIAKTFGAHPIIAIDGQAARLQLACDFGATHTIDLHDYPTSEARIARVMEITRGDGPI